MHSSTSQRGIKLIAETQKEVFLRSQNIFPDNLEIFNEAVIRRGESARLLGFSSFAAQKPRHKMVKSPHDIDQLLGKLYNHLQPLAHKDLETGDGEDADGSSCFRNFDYYQDRLLREKYDTSHELIAEYFLAEITIRRMLKAFEPIFPLKSLRSMFGIPTVRDDQSAFLRFLYLDIYPREGKYNHAAILTSILFYFKSYSSAGKQKQPVATALVCNVSQPSSGKRPLLQHRELITIFHDIHDLLRRSKNSMFHGHRTVIDFVEAPIQLLEYWCWVPECLQMLCCHYSYVSNRQWPSTIVQPPKEIPENLVRSLIAAKKRQLTFSKFDMQIHCPSSHHLIQSICTGEIYNSLLQKMTLLQGPENRIDWGNGHVTTSHYMWGQEANYYSHL
ncbi:hypothetical protein N7445_001863 [Penicillium cf. griseofulvum]|nr:hypothetical protein N7445_001863 [Penicillium cf. griseofulvum]